MNKLFKVLGTCLMLGFIWSTSPLMAQNTYSDYSTLTKRLKDLNNKHKNLTELTSLTKTIGGNDVWLLTIGSGDLKNNPAVAVIGGAKASHIVGSEITLEFAEKLLANANSAETKELLASTTFYVVPRLNPDATEFYFANLKQQRDGNMRSTDADRDGYFDEDGFEDLNKDGFITMMRVENPTGEWKALDEDPRVMVKANGKKGESGKYLLFTEGRDNDNDGAFNEDGEGGVNINQNFSFQFPYFKPGSSENPVSEKETMGLLDFLFEEARNTFAVISFGPENNLSSPLSFNRSASSKRVVAGWYSEDIDVNKLISELYNDTVDMGKAPSGAPQQGDLFQWVYYHYGRFSFSTPAWWTPEVTDENDKAKKFTNADAKFLAWADANNQDVFVEWTEINHPDFPGKKVEVGGIKPYSKLNPPYSEVEELATKHTDFILEVAKRAPKVELVNFKTESVGKDLTRVTVDVYNSGVLPTASRLGQRTNWARSVITKIDLANGMSLISGPKQGFERAIPGDGFVSKSWLIQGSGKITITAGSPMAGFAIKEQTIK